MRRKDASNDDLLCSFYYNSWDEVKKFQLTLKSYPSDKAPIL